LHGAWSERLQSNRATQSKSDVDEAIVVCVAAAGRSCASSLFFYTFIFPSFFFLLELTAFSADNGNQQ